MKFFATLIASVVSLAFLSVNAQECEKIYSRPNIHKMSPDKLNIFVNAVKELNSGPRPTAWDNLAQKHIRNNKEIHGNPMFLAWHRFFLYELETQLRKFDDSIRIPYWDWSAYQSDITRDPIWQIFGYVGNRDHDFCVVDGLFTGMSVLHGSGRLNDNGQCSTRQEQFKPVISSSIPELNLLIDSDTDYIFWEDLELVHHNRVHYNIGGDFGTYASPSDPLFWAHHAFVDKIWFDRQMRHPKSTLTYAISGNNKVTEYDHYIRDSFDPATMCYTYREDVYSWESRVRMQSFIPEVKPETFFPLGFSPNANTTSTSAINLIQSHAKGYVMKDVVARNMTEKPKFEPSGCEILPLPNPISIEYIRKMGYDEVIVRQIERKTALRVSEENKRCLDEQ